MRDLDSKSSLSSDKAVNDDLGAEDKVNGKWLVYHAELFIWQLFWFSILRVFAVAKIFTLLICRYFGKADSKLFADFLKADNLCVTLYNL